MGLLDHCKMSRRRLWLKKIFPDVWWPAAIYKATKVCKCMTTARERNSLITLLARYAYYHLTQLMFPLAVIFPSHPTGTNVQQVIIRVALSSSDDIECLTCPWKLWHHIYDCLLMFSKKIFFAYENPDSNLVLNRVCVFNVWNMV